MSGEKEFLRGRFWLRSGEGNGNRSHWLFRRSTGWPGNSSRSESIVGSRTEAGMFGKSACNRLAHGAVLFDDLWIDIQHVGLGLISVTNITGNKNGRRARHIRDAVRNQSATARFCGGHRFIALYEQFDDYFL